MTATYEFRLGLPLESASWVCREAIVGLDWYPESIEPTRLVLKKGARLATGSLSRIEVLLSAAGPDETSVTLNGKLVWGIGRWDERTLRGMMNGVRNAIEVTAERRAAR